MASSLLVRPLAVNAESAGSRPVPWEEAVSPEGRRALFCVSAGSTKDASQRRVFQLHDGVTLTEVELEQHWWLDIHKLQGGYFLALCRRKGFAGDRAATLVLELDGAQREEHVEVFVVGRPSFLARAKTTWDPLWEWEGWEGVIEQRAFQALSRASNHKILHQEPLRVLGPGPGSFEVLLSGDEGASSSASSSCAQLALQDVSLWLEACWREER